MFLHWEEGGCHAVDRSRLHRAVAARNGHNFIVPELRYHVGRLNIRRAELSDFRRQTRTFDCPVCDKGFIAPEDLNKHHASGVHDPRIFRCPTCDVRCASMGGLAQHVENASCGERLKTGPNTLAAMYMYVDSLFTTTNLVF